MSIPTADLCDAHPDDVAVVAPLFRSFGGQHAFGGPIATVKVHEDNTLVRAELEEPGAGRVLVVDGGGSLRCALLGDRLASLAAGNGWAGVLVWGCIRDAAAMGGIDLGCLALAANPRKSTKRGHGVRALPVTFGGVTFVPGTWLYADEDGVLVTPHELAP